MVSDKGKTFRKDREIQVEFESQVRDIQTKLQHQLKCLDGRLEAQNLMVAEIQEFFKRRAEIELDYGQRLDKLAKGYMSRQKQDKREAGSAFSTYTCWQQLLGVTRRQSKDHSVMADVFSTQMNARLNDVIEDSKRIFQKCKETASACHTEITKVLNELQTDMKQYHVLNNQAKQAESKYKHSDEMKRKLEQQATKGSRKVKQLDKQWEKRKEKFKDCKLTALKARNVYLLSIDAANAATSKYFVDDLSLLMDSMDFGYHNSMQRSLLLYKSCLDNLRTSHQTSIDCLNKCVQELDPNKDKQTFLTGNSALFTLPKKVEYQPHRGDEVTQVSAQEPVQDDLLVRFQQIHKRLDTLKLTNEEDWKSIEAADKNLVSMINLNDYDLTELFKAENPVVRPTVTAEMKKRRFETEAFYFQKFQSYLLESNLIARLQARHTTLKGALGDATASGGQLCARPPSLPPKPNKPRRVGKTPIVGQPKVFGCNLEEYIEATHEAIPAVLKSCVRAINLYGMHHEGVFRVSGLQAEINEFKAKFERGEDPLSDVNDSSSMNTIAGVLKSFFRDLQESLFPLTLFDAFIDASRVQDEAIQLSTVRELIYTSLSPQRIIVMRYLFAFLKHLSQYSDENLMYPYNLAICFGPTLLPIPQDKDQVIYQNNVNDLMKLILINCDVIFSREEPEGPLYEKIFIDPGDRDEADGSENDQSDDEEVDMFEATAGRDYESHVSGQLSFKKGDTLILCKQVSADWWEGAHHGKEGLIPDKYIHIKREDGSTPSTPSGSLASSKMAHSIVDSGLSDPGTPPPRAEIYRSIDSQLPTIHQVDDTNEKSRSTPNLPTVSERDASPSLEGTEQSATDSSKSSLEKVTEFSDSIVTRMEVPRQAMVDATPLEGDSFSTEALQDIDNTLAEVELTISSFETLNTSPQNESYSPKPARCTPDLVQDLPLEDPNSSSEQTSPVGSFNESTLTQSSAEVFANSDGTIVRIKSSSLPREPEKRFIKAQGHPSRELTSFKRSLSSSSTKGPREDRPGTVLQAKPKPTVTGNAIQVRLPSIPKADSDTKAEEDQPIRATQPVFEAKKPAPPPLKPKPAVLPKPRK